MARAKKKEKEMTIEEKLERALVPVEEQPYEIPENWCWVSLRYVARIIMGQSPAGESITDDNNYIALIGGAADMGLMFPETNRYTKQPTKISTEHDIILCIRATLGKPIFSDGEYCLGRGVAAIRPTQVNKYFLRYFLLNNEKYLYEHATGSTFLQVTGKVLEAMPFVFPPLPEQQRIVNRIDSIFSKLDEAKEKAQAVVDGFENRKAAILHKAFTGKLTERWRKECGVQLSSWHTVCFKDLGTSKLGKMLDIQKNEGEPTKYLRNINVRWFGFDLSNVGTMLATMEEKNVLSVKRGDLFICEGGEPGRCAVWEDNDSDYIFQKALHRFRPNKKVIGEYISYYLYYMSLNNFLNTFFTGTTIKHLTGKALAKVPIVLPEIEEQKELINVFHNLFENEKQAKICAEKVLIQIDILKKVILARAFRGELGTNVPEEDSVRELLKKVL